MDINSNVLFVDAEESVLESIKRMLMDNHINAHFAVNSKDAFDIINSNNIDTLFVDITSGNLVELLEKVQETHPNIVKVVISDFSHLTIIINSIRKLNLHSFLLKPWKKQELLETLKSADEYARFLKLQTREKENLEQKNVIYQRIINFKDDVGQANKADINSLKTSMFILAGEYEKLLKNQEGKDIELSLRALYNASEIFTASFPSFLEKFTGNDLINSLSLSGLVIKDETANYEFVKNLSLVREFVSRTQKFLTSFMGTNSTNATISKDNKDNIVITLESNYDSFKKEAMVLFFEYLKAIFNSLNVILSHEIYDEGNLKITLTI